MAISPLRSAFLIRKTFLTKAFRRSYSQFGEDIVLYDIFRGRIDKGFFVDVGCYHPFKFNNTYRLYKKGWRGVNIDLEKIKIEAFDLARRGDINITCAVSDQENCMTLYRDRRYSLGSTIDPVTAKSMMEKGEVDQQTVQTKSLNAVLEGTPYKNTEIDLLTIDCEGHDLNVLKSLNLSVYCPKILLIETHLRTVNELISCPTHKFLDQAGYELFNWVGLTAFYRSADFDV